jgi:hypothetical protein
MRILICHLFSRSAPADLGTGVGLDLDRDNLFLKPSCCNYGEIWLQICLFYYFNKRQKALSVVSFLLLRQKSADLSIIDP